MTSFRLGMVVGLQPAAAMGTGKIVGLQPTAAMGTEFDHRKTAISESLDPSASMDSAQAVKFSINWSRNGHNMFSRKQDTFRLQCHESNLGAGDLRNFPSHLLFSGSSMSRRPHQFCWVIFDFEYIILEFNA